MVKPENYPEGQKDILSLLLRLNAYKAFKKITQ